MILRQAFHQRWGLLCKNDAAAVKPNLMKVPKYSSSVVHSSHHYLLAHESLPFFVYSLPSHAQSILACDDSRENIVKSLMSNIDKQSDFRSPRTFSPDDIKSSEHPMGKGTCVLLQMPPPTSPTEAFFVAVFFSKTSKEIEALEKLPGDEGSEKARASIFYFTLEMAHPMVAGETGTVFCGRTPDGNHHFHGNGPKPDPDVFVEFLREHIERRIA